jgi:ADP-ribose pyrophosphatase
MGQKFEEKLVKSRLLHRGRAVCFRDDRVRLPDGKMAGREYMDHPGAVAVIPFVDKKTVVLVRQYRHPVRKTTLELPAGKLDPGENALACVRRELKEETGYTAKKVKPLLDYWPTPAFANEVLKIYLAWDLIPGKHQPDEDEFIEPVVMSFDKALGLVKSGKIMDSKTVIGLLACKAGLFK